MLEVVLVLVSGVLAGLLNSVAGGGTFFTLPVLILIGIPPTTANATATFSALPGYLSSAWAYRKDIKAEGTLSIKSILITACCGGLAGAFLLVSSSGDAFLQIVPFLLLIATLMFALNTFIMRSIRKHKSSDLGVVASGVAIFFVSIYGGYFNGGLGIVLLATFGLLGFKNLHVMNGLKTLLSAVLSFVSVVLFSTAEMIVWEYGLLMSIFTAIGGYIGARYIRRIVRAEILKMFIVLTGAVMTISFFVQNMSYT